MCKYFHSFLHFQPTTTPSQTMKLSKVKFGNFPEEIPIKFIQYSEIISAIKPLLNFSRLCGVPGFSYFDSVISKGGFCTFLNSLNILLMANQIFLLVLCLIRGEDFFRKSAVIILMRIQVIFVHLWSIFYSIKLATALRESPSLENRLKIYKEPTYIFYLRRKCLAAAALFVLVSLGLSVKPIFIQVFSKKLTFMQALESYGDSCKMEPAFLFHSSLTSSYCFASSLVTNGVWIFGDFLLLVLSITLGEMFRRLNKGIAAMEPEKFSAVEIDLVREHHGLTSKVVAQFDNAISVLNLINSVFNTAIIIAGAYTLVLGTKARGTKKLDEGMMIEVICKIVVAALKLVLGLIAASVLNQRAHAALSTVRSWPMAREFHDFTLHNGRASVIHAFLGQLSTPNIGFTISKFATITAKLLGLIGLGVAIFFAFTRITISACSGRSAKLVEGSESILEF